MVRRWADGGNTQFTGSHSGSAGRREDVFIYQRIIGLATFNRDRSETIDKQVRRLDELCQDAAGVNFNGFASRLREKGPHWSAPGP